MAAPTFLFADLSGFTALTEAHGDEQAADLAADFASSVRALLPDHSAEAVKTLGDAIMIRCPDAGQAVALGLRIVREIGAQPGFPSVRVGMHTGSAVERDGDWFGATVNLAARVTGAAAGGEVLLTDATRAAAGDLGDLRIRPRGRHELRNVPRPMMLHEARVEGARSDEGLPIDPVCRMAVDPEHDAGRLAHEGVTYHFCSLRCAGTFAADPRRFAAERGDPPGP